MKIKTVDSTANRAFMSMKADKAVEFDSLPRLGGHLSDLAEIQTDMKMSLDRLKVVVDRAEGGHAQSWTLTASPSGKSMRFRERALEQFCSRIRFPSDVLSRCPADLAKSNLDFFTFLSGEEKVLLRCEGDDIRAVLSDRYVSVAHREIVDKLLESRLKLKVNYAAVSAKRMFILLEDRDETVKFPDGTDGFHACMVGNSETGEGPFWGYDCLVNRICENRNLWGVGARGGRFRRIHVGGVRDDIGRLVEWLKAPHTEEVRLAEAAIAAAAMRIWKGDHDAILDRIVERTGVRKKEAEAAVAYARQRFGESAPVSDWTVLSGLTWVAQQDERDVDERYDLEVAAASLLQPV